MLRTLVNMNPTSDARSLEDVFDRLFGTPIRPYVPQAGTLPLDVYEVEGKLLFRAAVPGIDPSDLDIQIENNVLTIKGEKEQEGAGHEESRTLPPASGTA